MKDAFESLSDSVELIAILVRKNQQDLTRPYMRELEILGYDVKLFTERSHAYGWLAIR